jgi:hypothetical protein
VIAADCVVVRDGSAVRDDGLIGGGLKSRQAASALAIAIRRAVAKVK